MARAAAVVERRPLSRERVLGAALAIADEEGLDAVTLRRLASALGVHPTSIYNHVASKDAILDGMAEELIVEADLPTAFDDWRDWLRTFAVALRQLAREHPGAFLVFTRRPATGPAASAHAEGALEAFRQAGFPVQFANEVLAGAALTVVGLALNECPPIGPWTEPDVTHISAERFPRLTEAAALRITDTDGMWDAIIGSLITGLEARHKAELARVRK